MQVLSNYVTILNEWSGKLAAYMIYPATLILVYEVMARYLLNAPTIWAHGTSQRIFGIYFLLGAPYVMMQNGHIRMDIFYNKFSPRTRAIVDIITSPMLFATIFVLVYFGWDFAQASLKALETCNTPFNAPLWIVKLWVPITGILLILQSASNLIRDILTALFNKKVGL